MQPGPERETAVLQVDVAGNGPVATLTSSTAKADVVARGPDSAGHGPHTGPLGVTVIACTPARSGAGVTVPLAA